MNSLVFRKVMRVEEWVFWLGYVPLCVCAFVLASCASQLDIREGECSITMVEVDARTSTPLLGSIEADGWVMVQRGECPPVLIEIYKAVVERG